MRGDFTVSDITDDVNDIAERYADGCDVPAERQSYADKGYSVPREYLARFRE